MNVAATNNASDHQIVTRTVVLDQDNIDTDQIIPARFLTTTSAEGLGAHLFSDWRYLPDGSLNTEFPLNRIEPSEHQVLVAGHNFGCGSSREHAPWALKDFGFRAIVSTQIADIFRSNALKNGLIPVVVDADALSWLRANPGSEVRIDIGAAKLHLPGQETVTFSLDGFSRQCLIAGVDQLGYLLQQEHAIKEYEEKFV